MTGSHRPASIATTQGLTVRRCVFPCQVSFNLFLGEDDGTVGTISRSFRAPPVGDSVSKVFATRDENSELHGEPILPSVNPELRYQECDLEAIVLDLVNQMRSGDLLVGVLPQVIPDSAGQPMKNLPATIQQRGGAIWPTPYGEESTKGDAEPR